MSRAAIFEVRNAFLWTDFGMEFALRHFTQEQIDQLPKFVRGPKKGKVKGQIVWVKCLEGGYVYDSPLDNFPHHYVENRRGSTIGYSLCVAEYCGPTTVIATKYIPTAHQQQQQEQRTAHRDRYERELDAKTTGVQQ